MDVVKTPIPGSFQHKHDKDLTASSKHNLNTAYPGKSFLSSPSVLNGVFLIILHLVKPLITPPQSEDGEAVCASPGRGASFSANRAFGMPGKV